VSPSLAYVSPLCHRLAAFFGCHDGNGQQCPAIVPPMSRRAKAVLLGSVEARDEAEAIATAISELKVRPADRWRVSVRRA
jgi:hypothetical protein